MRLTAAEALLQDMGVTDPAEIDLEAIAFDVGARIRYQPLDGCEARILGANDKAIITVNSRSSPRRQRFSIAHELGHWHHHRGQCLMCRVEDFQPRSGPSPERTADRYAADLLMPDYLFRPLVRRMKKLDFATIRSFVDAFDISLTAAAIRVVEADPEPAMLVCHGKNGRRWFTRSRSVPDKWFPQRDLDHESPAFDVLHGREPEPAFPRKIGADAWFDRAGADHFEVKEQTVRTGPKETLTLLLFHDAGMLEETDTRRSWR